MSTHSLIGIMHGEVLKSVYCHWDGAPDCNGRILLEHYGSAKTNHLIALGNLSSLGSMLGEKHDFDQSYSIGSPEYNWCKFYGRDRDEPDNAWQVALTFEDFLEQCVDCDAEYYYVMRDGEWYCGDTYSNSEMSRQLVPLAQVLESIET